MCGSVVPMVTLVVARDATMGSEVLGNSGMNVCVCVFLFKSCSCSTLNCSSTGVHWCFHILIYI